MRIQLIFHNDTSIRIWKMNMNQVIHAHRPINFRPALRHLDVAPVLEGSKESKQVGRSFAVVAVIIAFWLSRFRRYWLTLLARQLDGGLVKTYQWKFRIGRALINIQHIFHVVHELRLATWRNTPLFPEPWLYFVLTHYSVNRYIGKFVHVFQSHHFPLPANANSSADDQPAAHH